MACTTEEPLAHAADIAERDTLKELLRRYLTVEVDFERVAFAEDEKRVTVTVLFDGEQMTQSSSTVYGRD